MALLPLHFQVPKGESTQIPPPLTSLRGLTIKACRHHFPTSHTFSSFFVAVPLFTLSPRCLSRTVVTSPPPLLPPPPSSLPPKGSSLVNPNSHDALKEWKCQCHTAHMLSATVAPLLHIAFQIYYAHASSNCFSSKMTLQGQLRPANSFFIFFQFLKCFFFF